METIKIKPLEEKYIKDIVRIHQNELGYTFNSRLGSEHLSFVYRLLANHTDSYVGVALMDDQPVGMISGTVDTDKIKSVLLKSLSVRQLLNISLHILKQPSLINEWRKGNDIGRELHFESRVIHPTLTTIAIDSRYHGKGFGKTLVNELELFFRRKSISLYRLDTLMTNIVAQKFYERLGFQKAENRADSIIYVKRISYES